MTVSQKREIQTMIAVMCTEEYESGVKSNRNRPDFTAEQLLKLIK